MGKNKPGYFKKWYENNKEALSERRRKRYESDSEYRKRVLDSTSKYRNKVREGKMPMKRRRLPKVFDLPNGNTLTLYSVGYLSTYIKRSVQTISFWQKKGLLPDTPYKVSGKFRYYTIGMIQVVRLVIGDRCRIDNFNEMPNIISEKWKILGVPLEASSFEEALKLTSEDKRWISPKETKTENQETESQETEIPEMESPENSLNVVE